MPAAAVDVAHLSLEGIHSTVAVPESPTQFWRNWRAYVGPALLVSVGYMDPGNWGTDLAAGAQHKYDLLWVVAAASLMAIFLQVLSARLGIVTGKDLAQACRDWYPRWTRWPNWFMCEVAIGACDLAEVLGSAVALNLVISHSAILGRAHHRHRRIPITGLAAVRNPHDRSRSISSWSRRSAHATSSNCSCCRKRRQTFMEMGRALRHTQSSRRRHGVSRHRNHRRHGHAAQPVLAFRTRAKS